MADDGFSRVRPEQRWKFWAGDVLEHIFQKESFWYLNPIFYFVSKKVIDKKSALVKAILLQAISWTNDHHVNWEKYASLSWNNIF